MRDWFEKLNDPSRDVYERRYRLLSALSILLLLVWLLVALVVDGYSFRILFFAICDLLFVPTMIHTLRSGNIQQGAGASGIVLVFLMLPFAFFFNGGIYAGAPNWCILALVFVTLTVKGRLRNFLLVSDILVTVACYILAWLHPELVDTFTEASAYADSIFSLLITAVQISVMFLFQLHMANQEREILESQRREILDLNRAQNRFFSSMSHEIRTPVNTIVGLNEMILREDISDEVAEDARQVRAAGRMLLHLVNDILDMSRLESGQMELVSEVYSLGELLSEVVGMIWFHAGEKGLDFRVDVDPQLPAALYGDEVRLKQILINLLSNAVKYTEKGSVSLSVQGRRDDADRFVLVFTVSDTGQGIKKEDIPGLFTAFRRVDSEQNRSIEGTGLGLSIVKQLVDRMDGSITVNSVYMQGSSFLLEIPQGEADTSPIGTLDLAQRHSGGRRQAYVPRFEAPEARVLVVDDNEANRMVVQKLLRGTGMRIDTAENGSQALQMSLETAYHLVFMDHLMPGMDGVTCFHRMRTQAGGLSKDARTVALTANADSESRRFYMQEGFDAWLSKPCSGEDLEQVCMRFLPEELVRRRQEAGEIVENSISWMASPKRKEELVVATDSIADLPASLIREYRIGVLPHLVRTADGCFRDGLEIEAAGLVDYMEAQRGNAHTEPPDTAAYEAFFAQQLARANHVLFISISGSIAGSGCPVAMEAARAFHNVSVVDSRHLSSGEGLLVLEACRLVRQGLSPDRIIGLLEEAKTRIHSSFIVDSLDYLERAGFASHRGAQIAKALMLRPVLRLKRGEIRPGQIIPGSRESAWKRYIASELHAMASTDRRILFVTYVGLTQKELEFIREEIRKKGEFERIVFQKASPAIAVNCGPGTFGLLFQRTA